MPNKYIRKVSTGASVVGGLQTSRYEKMEIAFGTIAADKYTFTDKISFGLPTDQIIDGRIIFHASPDASLDIYPGLDLSVPLIVDGAAVGAVSYVLRYLRGTGIVGAASIPLTIEFDNSVLTASTFSPAAGTFTTTQTVSITTAKTDDKINYTTDGSTPSATVGTLYTGPITVAATTTVKAIAFKDGDTSSSVVTAVYTITPVANPTFSPVAGAYTGDQTITISTVTAGASIRYTTNGSAPSATVGTVYTAPVDVPVTATLKAIAYKTNSPSSAVVTAAYTIS